MNLEDMEYDERIKFINESIEDDPMGSLKAIANYESPWSGVNVSDVGYALRQLYDTLYSRMVDMDILFAFSGWDSE